MTEITSGFGNAPLLIIKDPRICRLLPLYLEAFDVLDIEPLVILQVRPMAEVVRSLADRDELDPDHSELLWLRSLVEAEWYSRRCTRAWVSFEQIIADWHGSVCRIGATLGVAWPIDPDGATSLIAPVLKPRLNHGAGVTAGSTSVLRTNHPTLSRQAWTAAENGIAGNEVAAQAAFDAVRATLDDLDRMYQPLMTSVRQRHEGALAVIRQRNEAALAVIRASTCWRITAPLRAISHHLQRARSTRNV